LSDTPRRKEDLPADDRILAGRVAVLSPHLDDAVFSLGAAIARASRSGSTCTIVTVFAGDPESTAQSGWWDRQAGFSSEGEAARARREEDRTACGLLGAIPLWLPFSDATYEQPVEDGEISEAVAAAVQDAETVLVPGYPLAHVDHARLARLTLERDLPVQRIGLYVEQPYAKRQARRRAWRTPAVPDQLRRLLTEPVAWTRLAAERGDRQAKHRAALAYHSQIPLFGRGQVEALGRLLIRRVALYEAIRGGEAVAWLKKP
jgi:LmbE family N-acetylglucosaminyl deacetylase